MHLHCAYSESQLPVCCSPQGLQVPAPHKLRHHLLLQTGDHASRLLFRRDKAGELTWPHFEIEKQLLGPLQAVRG